MKERQTVANLEACVAQNSVVTLVQARLWRCHRSPCQVTDCRVSHQLL